MEIEQVSIVCLRKVSETFIKKQNRLLKMDSTRYFLKATYLFVSLLDWEHSISAGRFIGGYILLHYVPMFCNFFISKQMLVNQLRELEADNIIDRIVYAEIPLKVVYELTDYGKSLMPIIGVIQQWGEKDLRGSSCEAMGR